MADGLKAETLRQIYTTLEKCAAVGSQARLRVLFVDSRIAQWRGIVPEADNRSERIYLLVDRLLDQQNAQEQSALALFLWVVSDNHETSIKYRRDLRSIAQAVTYELGFAPLNLSPPQSVGRNAPTVEPAVQESAATTLEETPGKQLADHKPTLWQMAAQWWLSLPVTGRRALGGVAGVALVIWLAVALANANAPTPTITPQATQAVAAATEPTEMPTLQPSHTPTPRPPTATPTPSLTPPPTLGIGSMMTSTVDGMVQMYIPAGPFTMGSDYGNSNEQPVHTVTLDAYWIDQTEVTNDQFAQFVAATSYKTTAEQGRGSYTYSSSEWNFMEGTDWQHPQGPGSNLTGLGDHAVVHVSWYDATAYCEWTGRRLPTEAEWEKAARSADERTYPWGEEVNCKLANYGNCVGEAVAVGSYPTGTSPYGTLDMVGNVWEWALSLFQPYPYNSNDGRENLNATGNRVLRGGAWYNGMQNARTAIRNDSPPDGHNDAIGFRCAQEYVFPTSQIPIPPTATPTPSLTPPPTLGVGSMMTSTVDGMVQMYVPAGPFTMGSDYGFGNEQPVHTVTLDAFWIDQTEVTNDQFAQFVGATSYETTAEEEGGGYIHIYNGWGYTEGADWQHPQGLGSNLDGLGDHPVVLVSWHDAAAYCEWTGRRLPTEAEWEKAARGTDARVYPWGDQFDGNRLNFCDSNCPLGWKDDSIDDGYQFTAPVGSYPTGASPYGALDMAGNVWEWTFSLYQDYPYNANDGRESGDGTNVRAHRGGSWDFIANYIRAAYRNGNAPADRNGNVGFRCAQE